MKKKMPSPKSSSLVSTEIKHPFRTIVLSCACHIVRSLSRAKSFLIKAVQRKLDILQIHFTLPAKKGNKNSKIYFGSFRFHYNWGSVSSSHLQPLPTPFSTRHIYYYDPTWDSMISMEPAEQNNCGNGESSQLSKYLEWLEEKGQDEELYKGNPINEGCVYEIDKLADIFIAKCHQNFILEKQESYRRFQEMISI